MSTTNRSGAQGSGKQRKHLPGSRYRSRVTALCLLFEAECRDVDPVVLAEERREYARALNESGEEGVSQVSEYAIKLVNGVAVELDHIDETIDASLTNWTLDRLSAIDRAILRIGSWELLYAVDDVPPVTAVDESVALAREYSSDDAPSFVNAVLDRVLAVAQSARAAAALRRVEDEFCPEDEDATGDVKEPQAVGDSASEETSRSSDDHSEQDNVSGQDEQPSSEATEHGTETPITES